MGRPVTIFRFNQSGLLFVPAGWQRAAVVRWLKRVHAWTGFWGAILFFVLGLSGMLLNHRSIMPIETGKPVEVSSMDVAVNPRLISDHKALERWAAAEFGLTGEPRLETQPKDKAERKGFLGRERTEAEKWKLSFARPNGRVIVEYVPGSPSVSVRQQANNLLGVVKNLHKGTGLGVFWVLFLDSIAGALVAMSITGFLLWTRLHGTRLLAGGILAASVVVATGAVWPNWL